MQVLITHGSMARTRVLRLQRWQLLLGLSALVCLLLALSGTVYHVVFLKAAREGWPVVSPLVKLIVRDEVEQRERFMRDNLDAMAQKLGEMQAKLVKLEAMGERVSGLAGVRAEEREQLKRSEATPAPGGMSAPAVPGAPAPGASAPGSGRGGLYLPLSSLRAPRSPSMEQLQRWMSGLDEWTDLHTDLLTLAESRLMEVRLAALLQPSALPVEGPVGSGFGVRTDPITGRPALHTGLDFPAAPGTPIRAAAGGMVVTNEWHDAYGNLLEIDHGNGLRTRYAHASSIDVPLGALVKRGQVVAKVGNTGRSTGPHLHFEVLVEGVPQNPARFLAGSARTPWAFAQPPQPR